jgi:hypothetical protein
MPRLRLTIVGRPNSIGTDDEYAEQVIGDVSIHVNEEFLWDREHGPFPRNSQHQISLGLFFQFDPVHELRADKVEDVRAAVEVVLRDFRHSENVRVDEVIDSAWNECPAKCQYTTRQLFPSICPCCNRRNSDPCPHCGADMPFDRYRRLKTTDLPALKINPDAGVNTHYCKCPSCGGDVKVTADYTRGFRHLRKLWEDGDRT